MKYFRIYTMHKKTFKILESPFVFTEEDVIKRCSILNEYFTKGNHVHREAESYVEEEIRDSYVDIAPNKLIEAMREVEL